MALNSQQQQIALQLYQMARSRGLPDPRAREFVAAAYAESGLDPRATNRSSGAAGLYQLLSSGYRQRAQTLGGLYNPRANANAILPDYLNYWRSHPGALPGAAGRDVERSGMGADFYSRPLSQLPSQFGGGVPAQAAPGPRPARRSLPAAPGTSFDPRQQILQQLASGGNVNFLQLARQAQAPQFQTLPARKGALPPVGPLPAARGATPTVKPLGRFQTADRGKLIGFPYQGTHTMYGNWESDRAVDIALPRGTPVYAPFSGVIGSQIGALNSKDPHLLGLRVHLDSNAENAYLAHLSRLVVKAGQRVQKGQLLGYSGVANGVAHLHFATRKKDPRAYVG